MDKKEKINIDDEQVKASSESAAEKEKNLKRQKTRIILLLKRLKKNKTLRLKKTLPTQIKKMKKKRKKKILWQKLSKR